MSVHRKLADVARVELGDAIRALKQRDNDKAERLIKGAMSKLQNIERKVARLEKEAK